MLPVLALVAAAGCGEERVALDSDAACSRSECRVAADYGDLGAVAGSAQEIQESVVWFGTVEDECGAPVVELSVELVAGRGAFAADPDPGTISLTGEELDPDTCGACVRLIVDDGKCYFATGGTLVLSKTVGDLAGTLTGADFGPVDCIDGRPIAGECAAVIAAMSFNEMIGGDPD